MKSTPTKKQCFDLMANAYNKPPETLQDFELWLLDRAHKPEDPQAQLCAEAWRLARSYRLAHLCQSGTKGAQ